MHTDIYRYNIYIIYINCVRLCMITEIFLPWFGRYRHIQRIKILCCLYFALNCDNVKYKQKTAVDCRYHKISSRDCCAIAASIGLYRYHSLGWANARGSFHSICILHRWKNGLANRYTHIETATEKKLMAHLLWRTEYVFIWAFSIYFYLFPLWLWIWPMKCVISRHIHLSWY